MRYCKIKSTGELLSTQSGDDDLEVMYSNNSAYARDELEVGVEDASVIDGWRDDWKSANRTYSDKRKSEYPTLEELVVALYDTDDKAAIEKRRADVKAKYPKPE